MFSWANREERNGQMLLFDQSPFQIDYKVNPCPVTAPAPSNIGHFARLPLLEWTQKSTGRAGGQLCDLWAEEQLSNVRVCIGDASWRDVVEEQCEGHWVLLGAGAEPGCEQWHAEQAAAAPGLCDTPGPTEGATGAPRLGHVSGKTWTKRQLTVQCVYIPAAIALNHDRIRGAKPQFCKFHLSK